MKRTILAFCAAALLAVPGSADDRALVAQAYPQYLDDRFHELYQEDPADEPSRLSNFTRADLDGSGDRSYLVAGYTNGTDAVLRVINANGSVIAESPRLTGGGPRVEVVDLDGAGGEEIILSLAGVSGNEANWIFRWSAGALALDTPVTVDEDGYAETLLVDAGWADLDGDGVQELLAPAHVRPFPEDVAVVQSYTVYRRSGSGWTVAAPVTRAATFIRETGQPESVTETFVANPGDYVLRIVNGGAASAVVALNGATVAAPNAFNRNTRVIEVPVTLAAENTLSVEMRSAPGSEMLVVLRPAE